MNCFIGKKTEKNNYSPLLLIVLAMTVSNIFLMGSYILLALVLLYFVCKKQIILTYKSLLLLAFAITYLCFGMMSLGFSLSLFKPLIYVLIWIMIYNISSDKSIEQIFTLMVFLAFGMASHGLVNFLYNTQNGVEMSKGISFDFWSQTYSSATGQAINFTLLIAIAFWMIFLQKKKLLKIIGVIFFVCSLLYDIQLGGRTFFVITLISLACGILILVIESFFYPYIAKKTFGICIIIGCVILIIVLIFQYNLFNAKSAFEKSYIYRRLYYHSAGNIADDSRFNRKSLYYSMFFDNLFGGGKISGSGIGAAHELWLDIFDQVGFIPYILIIIYSVSVIWTIWNIVKKCKIAIFYKNALIIYTVVIFSQFFVEPIMAGAPMLFSSFLIIDAALTSFCRDNADVQKFMMEKK